MVRLVLSARCSKVGWQQQECRGLGGGGVCQRGAGEAGVRFEMNANNGFLGRAESSWG